MKTLLRLSSFLLPLLLLVTCTPPTDPAGDVKGIVQCESGGPVEGASVSLDPGVYSATTGTDGAFLIAGVAVGTYTARVESKEATTLMVDGFAVSDGKTTDLGVLLLSCDQPCSSNDACSTGSYCAKTAGDCGGQGICSVRPSLCAAVVGPVCGCDGKTYSNSCEAAVAGTNVASQGACAPPPAAGCTSNTGCAASEYCAKAKGDCDGTGTCKSRPDACIALYDPVTGCNGILYGNSCEAARIGVNVR